MNDHKNLSHGRFLASALPSALALALAVVPADEASAQVFAVGDISSAGVEVATSASQLVAGVGESASAGCGWCRHWRWPGHAPRHVFPRGNDSCTWPPVPLWYRCARCGSGKGCHTFDDPGGCHIRCGPAGGDLAQILGAVQRGFQEHSATAVADALQAAPADIQVEYLSDAGRIDFILQCAPGATAETIPVPTGEIRAALDAELETRRDPRYGGVPTPLP